MVAAISSIGDHLQPDTLVVLESTTCPGTTEEVVRPLLEKASDLRAGTDFWLAFSPLYVVQRIQSLLNDESRALKGSTVLLLEVTYKPNIADQRETPARPLAEQLLQLGARVQYFDPFVPKWQVDGTEAVAKAHAAAAEADLTVLVQVHDALDVPSLVAAARRFFDLRGVTCEDGVERL